MATRTGALLELLLANSQELFGDVVVKSSFGCSDPNLLEVKILRGMRKTIEKNRPWTSEEQTYQK